MRLRSYCTISKVMPQTLVQAAEALHVAIKQVETGLTQRDAGDELAAWSLQSVRTARAGVQKALARLTVEEELFADETLEGYSDTELGNMLANVRNSSRRLATLSAASIFYDPALLEPDGCALPPPTAEDSDLIHRLVGLNGNPVTMERV